MTTIHAHDVRPGDVIVHDGRVHRITRVDHRPGWSWPIAADGTGWAIALGRHSVLVHRAQG